MAISQTLKNGLLRLANSREEAVELENALDTIAEESWPAAPKLSQASLTESQAVTTTPTVIDLTATVEDAGTIVAGVFTAAATGVYALDLMVQVRRSGTTLNLSCEVNEEEVCGVSLLSYQSIANFFPVVSLEAGDTVRIMVSRTGGSDFNLQDTTTLTIEKVS